MISPVAGRWSSPATVSPAASPVTGIRATIVPGELESNRTSSGEALAVTPTIASAAWLVAGIARQAQQYQRDHRLCAGQRVSNDAHDPS